MQQYKHLIQASIETENNKGIDMHEPPHYALKPYRITLLSKKGAVQAPKHNVRHHIKELIQIRTLLVT